MTKLETVKDLGRVKGHTLYDAINADELKRQVIKWIKADTKDLCEILEIELNERDLMIIDLVLKKINNITEEDLK